MTSLASVAAPGHAAGSVGAAAPRRRGLRIPSLAFLVYALALGGGLGVGSAVAVLGADYPFGRVRVGPWTAWPQLGSREADPYMRAIIARRGDLPLGLGEGLALLATEDSAGRPLEGRCRYRLGDVTPPARAWTLALYAEDSRTSPSSGSSGLTSSEVLRDGEGRFSVIMSREASPGNWLRMPDGERVSLALRLYDTPVAAGSVELDPSAFPSIDRVGCEE